MMAGSLNLAQIVAAQSRGWFIIPQALGALIFLVTSVAEMERLPFDLPEAESEIMMGWQAEYPGVLFLAAQGPGFVKLYAFSALFTTIFLGGFLGPSFLPPLFWMLSKTLIVIVLIMLLRSTFPRVRLDQLLRAGWTTLLTLAIINIGITYILVVGLPTL
jgi:NADH-quinone oxidoreductase subunit H